MGFILMTDRVHQVRQRRASGVDVSQTDARPTTLSYVLLVNPMRSISDDHWDEIEANHIHAWREATVLLKSWTYSFDRQAVSVSVDWQPVFNRVSQMYQWHVNLHAAIARRVEPDLRFPHRPVAVKVGAEIDPEDVESEHIARHVTESFIYDVFLMMNLASAGPCNFYHARLRERLVRRPMRNINSNFGLSEYGFDLANLDGYEGKWPAPRTLPLSRVIDWYKRVRVGASQIPSNRMEKVLFALMHIARTDVSVNTVVWLFYALETFFDTRPGENFRTLVSRIELLLSPTDHQKASLRKNLRALYELRSSFVHGGRDVIHPLHNEAVDSRVNDQYRELMTTTEFGFAVLLASVQEAVFRGWTELTFAESVSGAP